MGKVIGAIRDPPLPPAGPYPGASGGTPQALPPAESNNPPRPHVCAPPGSKSRHPAPPPSQRPLGANGGGLERRSLERGVRRHRRHVWGARYTTRRVSRGLGLCICCPCTCLQCDLFFASQLTFWNEAKSGGISGILSRRFLSKTKTFLYEQIGISGDKCCMSSEFLHQSSHFFDSPHAPNRKKYACVESYPSQSLSRRRLGHPSADKE